VKIVGDPKVYSLPVGTQDPLSTDYINRKVLSRCESCRPLEFSICSILS